MRRIHLLPIVTALVAGLFLGYLQGRRAKPDEAKESRATVHGDEPSESEASEPAAKAEEIQRELAGLGYLSGYREPSSEGGVMIHDRDRVEPGVMLVVSGHRPGAALIDTDGRTIHEWELGLAALTGVDGGAAPSPAGRRGWWRRAKVLPGGDVIGIIESQALFRLDRESNVRWARREHFHHYLDLDSRGRLVALDRVRVEIERENGKIGGSWRDRVVYLDLDGRIERAIYIDDALAASPWAPLARRTAKRRDPLHTNTAEVLDGRHVELHPAFAAGNILLSFRHLDAIAVLDPVSERIVWLLTGLWQGQHEPSFTPDGHILLFDNNGVEDRSRVIEVDPLSQRIARSWSGGGLAGFHSRIMGMVQRLEGGDLLITESTAGRVFQVARDDRVVWQYDNPNRTGGGGKLVGALAQVERLEPALAAEWRSD